MEQYKVWIKRLFAISACIACFTCYDRADYNLPLFAFAYLLWDQPKPVTILSFYPKNIFTSPLYPLKFKIIIIK